MTDTPKMVLSYELKDDPGQEHEADAQPVDFLCRCRLQPIHRILSLQTAQSIMSNRKPREGACRA